MSGNPTIPATVPVELRALVELQPFARNARTHSPEQVSGLERLIAVYGYTSPILHDDGLLVAGHCRLQAMQNIAARGEAVRLPSGQVLPVGTIPAINCHGWSEAQRRAYTLADNRSAELAGWDDSMLRLEFAFLDSEGFDLELTGFDAEAVTQILAGDWQGSGTESEELKRAYSQTVNSPMYEPQEKEAPPLEELIDRTKSQQLTQAIMAAEGITPAEREFLLHAAARHTVFNFHRIAEFYCHASPQMQDLMEASALVIIDFDRAIADGFVRMGKRIDQIYAESYTEGT